MSAKVNWYPEAFIAKVHAILGDKLEESAEIVKTNAQIECPVKTGRLRNSIDETTDKTILKSYIGTSDVPYAYFVEVGTRKMTPRKYLRKGLYASINAIIRIFSTK
jgi:HK97 gp10 family phage protein